MEQNEKNEAFVIVVKTESLGECYLSERDVVVSKIHGAKLYHDEIYVKSDLSRVAYQYKGTQCAWLNDEKNLSIKKVVILDGNKNYKVIEPDEHCISVMYPNLPSLNTAFQKVMFGIQNSETKFLSKEEEETIVSLTRKWCKAFDKFKEETFEQILKEIEGK